jgi:gliding motility-associated-like protein
LTDSLLIANDDIDTIRARQPKVINLFTNDTIRLGVTNFEILNQPLKGRIDTISRGLIRYTPLPGTCDWDSLTYIVCVPNRCDTAVARIFIVCSDSLKAYNGFSPNGDQFNQVFVIEGIERYPNHTLCIFNRWGERVMFSAGYQNDWDGKWNGQDLPDGTYFYLLRNEDDKSVLLSGYLQIFR